MPDQYTAIHFTETLMLAGLIPSVGTVGDTLDNAWPRPSSACTRPLRNGEPSRTHSSGRSGSRGTARR